ncbi:MAG: hypothetical protein JW915_10840 [Chitinispirillaceae bacterium]|nr:hypothetical protein [Chitinispirillaceae bacterium]
MKISTILLCVFLFALPAHAERTKTIDLKDTRIDLPWKEFKEILNKASEPVNKPLPDTLFSSTDYLISNAVINGKVLNRNAARFVVKVSVIVPLSTSLKQNNWVAIPIGTTQNDNSSKGVLERAELNGADIPVHTTEDNLQVLLSKAGTHTLTLTYYCPVTNEEGNYKIAFSVPRAASARLEFIIPKMRSDVWINGIKRVVTIKNNNTGFNSVISLEDELLIRYSQIGEDFADEENGNRIVPKSFATSGLLVTIKENRINYQYRVDYQIWHQKRKTFSILLPDSLQIENVQGAGISEWKVEHTEKGIILKVSTTFAPERTYTINIEFNQKLKTAESTVEIPVLSILDVKRQNGYLSVNASEAIEVFADEVQEKLTDASTGELPEWLQMQKDVLMTYKYTSTPYKLSLKIKRHKDVPVLVAIADEGLFTGIVTNAGYSLVKFRYFIRNNHKQYLRVSMPEGWELWSALIDGNAVMPASSTNGNEVLLPLKKLSKTEEGAGFVLELVYWNQQKKFGLNGNFRFETPVVDINCQKVNGEMYFPEKYTFKRVKGSIQNVESYSNKYLNSSWKTDAPVAQRQFQNRVKGNAMSLPVEIEIPSHGIPLRFTKGLTIAGEKSEVLCTYNKKLVWPPLLATVIVSLLIFAISFFTSRSLFITRTVRNKILISISGLTGILFLYIFALYYAVNYLSVSGIVICGLLFAALRYFSRNRKAAAV